MRILCTHSRVRAIVAFTLGCLLLVPVLAFAATREAVLSRGEVWISRKVPYSQAGYATASGQVVSSSTQGWRRDCSGFASMSLGLVNSNGSPLSLDTATLPYRLNRIGKSELKPGDVILRPKNLVIDGKQVPYGHAIVFVRWVDAAKTRYIGYHQSSSRGGAVSQEIAYPFWGEKGFSPYRYKKIEDVRLRRSRGWLGPVTPPGSVTASPSADPTGTIGSN